MVWMGLITTTCTDAGQAHQCWYNKLLAFRGQVAIITPFKGSRASVSDAPPLVKAHRMSHQTWLESTWAACVGGLAEWARQTQGMESSRAGTAEGSL